MGTRLLHALVVSGAVMMGGCGESTSPEPGVRTGELSFTYNSPEPRLRGTFTAVGPPPFYVEQSGVWAAGLARMRGYTQVYAADGDARSSGWASVLYRDEGTGTTPIRAECPGACSFVNINLKVQEGEFQYEYWCFLTEGSVTVASRSGTRARGTFSGSGECASPMAPATTIRVTDGAFDVALVPDL